MIEKENLIQNAHVVGKYLKGKLIDLSKKYRSIGDVRGVGLSIGIELVREQSRPNPALAEIMINELRNNHIMISRTGEFNHVLKIRPPIVASIDNCNLFLETFERIIASNQGKTMTSAKI